MRSLEDVSADLERPVNGAPVTAQADRLLRAGEDTLVQWNLGRGFTPTDKTREGFRLLALHRQGAKGEPSFNACRETCRELVYHYNLVTREPDHPGVAKRLEMMRFVAMHLFLFVHGKIEVEGLGEFCCASRPLRTGAAQQP